MSRNQKFGMRDKKTGQIKPLKEFHDEISSYETPEGKFAYGPLNKEPATYLFEEIVKDILDDHKHPNKTPKINFIKQDGKVFIERNTIDPDTGKLIQQSINLRELLDNVNFSHIQLDKSVSEDYMNDVSLIKVPPNKSQERHLTEMQNKFDNQIDSRGFSKQESDLYHSLELGEMLAINKYTHASIDVNMLLWETDNTLMAPQEMGNTLVDIAMISQGLNKLPNSGSYAIRGQGADGLDDWKAKTKDGSIITNKGFFSASKTDLEKFDLRSGGTKLIFDENSPGKFIAPFSELPGESEILFLPNSQNKPTGYTTPSIDDGHKFAVSGVANILNPNDNTPPIFIQKKPTAPVHIVPKTIQKPITNPNIVSSKPVAYNKKDKMFSSIAARRQEMEQNLPMFRPGDPDRSSDAEEYQKRKLQEKKQAMHHAIDMSEATNREYHSKENPRRDTPQAKVEAKAKATADILLNEELKNIRELEHQLQAVQTSEEKLYLQNLQHDQIQKLNKQLEIIEQQLEQSKYLEGSKSDVDITQLAEIKAQKYSIEGQIKALEKIKDKSSDVVSIGTPPPPPAPPLPESWDKIELHSKSNNIKKTAYKPSKTKEQIDQAVLGRLKNDSYDDALGDLRKNKRFMDLQKKLASREEEKKNPPPTPPKSDVVRRVAERKRNG